MKTGEGLESAGDHKPIPELFTPQSRPYGLSFGEWTVRWWQWFLSQPKSSNPANDKNRGDRNGANNQRYQETWFLAGTTGGFAERECIIQKERSILCPIINFEISKAEEPTLKTDEDLVCFAKNDVDKIEKLNLSIDDVNLPDLKKFRVESGPFDVTLPEDNICGVKAGPTRAAADGYWLYIKHLDPGDHQVRFGGSCLSGTINVGTMYYISVQ